MIIRVWRHDLSQQSAMKSEVVAKESTRTDSIKRSGTKKTASQKKSVELVLLTVTVDLKRGLGSS